MSISDPKAENTALHAALLAGGKGTRFWPASRSSSPKQFLRLIGERTLLRLSFDRCLRLLPPDRVLVVTNPSYADRTRSELPELPLANLVLEPSGHNTAPAAALAARVARQRDAEALLLVAPTDHFVQDEAAFEAALRAGLAAAAGGALVTFGVVPDRPATSYGYIEVEKKETSPVPLPVLRFREKPAARDAAEFLASGRFYWNAGIFAWRADVFEEELAAADPSLAAAIAALPPPAPPGSEAFDRFKRAWELLPSISIDYALMERSSKVRVVPLAAGWSDVGGWDAVRDLLPSDADGNRPGSDVLYVRARNCSVHRPLKGAGTAGKEASARRFFAFVETDGLIVVDTPDAVLICRAGEGESLREVVKRLPALGREDLL